MMRGYRHSKEIIYEMSQCSEFRRILDSKPSASVHGTAILLAALLAIAVTWSWLAKADLVVVAHGRIRPPGDATRVFVGSDTRLLGRVISVEFVEGQQVSEGQVLLRLSSQLIDSEIARHEIEMEAARDELDGIEKLTFLLEQEYQAEQEKTHVELQAEVRKVNATKARRASKIRQARAQVAESGRNAERYRVLVEKEVVPEAVYEMHAAKYQSDLEALRTAELPVEEGAIEILSSNERLIRRNHQVRLAEMAARRALKNSEVRAAQEDLAGLALRRKNAEILAPVDGVIVAGRVKVGDVLDAGQPVVEIAEVDALHFEVNVRSDQIAYVSLGQLARVKFTALDHQDYGAALGRVVFVAPDSRAANSMKRDGQGFAYAVRIRLDDEYLASGKNFGELKLGMVGAAEIIAGRERIFNIFTKKLRYTISLG